MASPRRTQYTVRPPLLAMRVLAPCRGRMNARHRRNKIVPARYQINENKVYLGLLGLVQPIAILAWQMLKRRAFRRASEMNAWLGDGQLSRNGRGVSNELTWRRKSFHLTSKDTFPNIGPSRQKYTSAGACKSRKTIVGDCRHEICFHLLGTNVEYRRVHFSTNRIDPHVKVKADR